MTRNYRARGITSDGKPIFAEKHEQQVVAGWLMVQKIFFIHVPNELPNLHKGKATPQDRINRIIWQKQQKTMGKRPGVADFLIFDPPPLFLDRWPKGTVLELKALDGDEPTSEQYEFMSEMGARGYATNWFRGADAAVRWLESIGYGPRNGAGEILK